METLSPKCRAFIVGKMRLAWRYYSQARKECLTAKKCVFCKKSTPKLYADHIHAVGSFNPEQQPYLQALFVDKQQLQPLCAVCHNRKTKKENAQRRLTRAKK